MRETLRLDSGHDDVHVLEQIGVVVVEFSHVRIQLATLVVMTERIAVAIVRVTRADLVRRERRITQTTKTRRWQENDEHEGERRWSDFCIRVDKSCCSAQSMEKKNN